MSIIKSRKSIGGGMKKMKSCIAKTMCAFLAHPLAEKFIQFNNLNYTPCELQKPFGFWRFAPLAASSHRSRSNFACLPDEQAHRLGCAALSAPPLALQATAQERQISPPPPKSKKTVTRMGNCREFELCSLVAQVL